MVGVVVGLVTIVAFGATGTFLALLLGLRSLADVVLAAYVLAFAELVVLVLALSLFEEATRGNLVFGALALLGASVGGALMLGVGRPRLPKRADLHSLAATGPVLTLGLATVGAFTYVVALLLGTPPNGWDPLNYHLARAALWIQSGQVGYIADAYDQRLNFNPPNAEIAMAAVLQVTRREVSAGVVQLTAALACSVGVFALARRLQLELREAAFGALLVLLMPIVLLQSSGAKNDLVVASFLVAAAVFLIRSRFGELVVAGAAIGLAVGTKFTAVYGLAVLVALALIAEPRGARWRRLGVLGLGAAFGAYWYGVNALESGAFLGDQSNVPGLTAVLHPRENMVTAAGLMVDAIDLSGAVGVDIFVFAFVALALAAGLLLAARGEPRARRGALVAGLVVLVPFPLYALTTWVGRPALVSLYDALGEPNAYLAEGSDASSPTLASDTGSWFGPVGLLLAVGVFVVAAVLVRGRSLAPIALVLAAAPLGWLLLASATLTYHPWQGRFFVLPMALSASLWGLTLRARALAWAAVALASTTAALSLLHFQEKPSGRRLLERAPAPSVWNLDRAAVQSLHDPPLQPLLAYVEASVPPNAPLGLALGANEFGYPYFGSHLGRRIVLVPFGSTAADLAANWLVANPERAREVDRSCWTQALATDRGAVFRRVQGACGS